MIQARINKKAGRTYLLLPLQIFRDTDIKEVVFDFKEAPFTLIMRAAGLTDNKTFRITTNGEYSKMVYFNLSQINFDPSELEGLYNMEIDDEEYIFTRVPNTEE